MREDESDGSEDVPPCVIGGEREKTLSDGAFEVQWVVHSKVEVQRTEKSD